MDKRKSAIYKLMARYFFEMVMVVLFMLVSYSGFTMNNLSEASKIASLSSSQTREIQVLYSREDTVTAVSKDASLIDRGTLYIKNPNKVEKNMNVVIQLKQNEAYTLGDLQIFVDGEEVDLGVVLNTGEIYEVILDTIELDSYESTERTIAIFSKNGQIPLEYSFKIVGSF